MVRKTATNAHKLTQSDTKQHIWTSDAVIERLREAMAVHNALSVSGLRPQGYRSSMPDYQRSYVELLAAESGRIMRKGKPRFQRQNGQLICVDMGPPQTSIIDGKPVERTHWARSFTRPAPPDRAALDRAGEVLGWSGKGVSWLSYVTTGRERIDTLWFIYGFDLSCQMAAIAYARKNNKRPPDRETVRRWRDEAVTLIVEGLNARASNGGRAA
jgi:hypothetical protein